MDNKANRITLLCLSLVMSIILLNACGGQVINPTEANLPNVPAVKTVTQTSPTATSQQVEQSLSADSAKDAVIYALQALSSQSNTMDVTTTLADGTTQHNVISFVPPDRKQIVDSNSGMEYIIIGQTVFSKDSTTGQWMETSIPASMFMGDNTQDQQNFNDIISDVQLQPAATSDGKSFLVVRYVSTNTTNGVTLNSQTEIWLDQADGLAYKMITDGEIYSASMDPSTGESHALAAQAQTTTIITYDPNLKIEAPLP
jgi:hypothetical protein